MADSDSEEASRDDAAEFRGKFASWLQLDSEQLSMRVELDSTLTMALGVGGGAPAWRERV